MYIKQARRKDLRIKKRKKCIMNFRVAEQKKKRKKERKEESFARKLDEQSF